MRRMAIKLSLAAILGIAASAQQARLWFSLTGVPEGEPIGGTPPEYTSNTQGANPVIDAGAGGTARLYVWGTLDNSGRNFSGVSLDVNVSPEAGTVSLVDSRFYNYDSLIAPPARRWDSIWQGTITPTNLDDALLQAPFGWGWGYRAAVYGDKQYDPQTRSMLLGFVDLEMSPGARAALFFGVGPYGFVTHPHLVEMHFGWGDAPVLQPPYAGQQSTLPDATIVPEPATALLTLTSGLVLWHRPTRT